MMRGKLQALFRSLRPASRRISSSKTATASNSQSLEQIGRECTAVGNVLRLRAKEQSVETLLREREYQEKAESFESLKEICRTPKKKRSSKRNKKRAAEMLAALTRASAKKKASAAGGRLSFSTTRIFGPFRHKPSAGKIIRRHSFILSGSSRADHVSQVCCQRSSKSFVEDAGHGVEAS